MEISDRVSQIETLLHDIQGPRTPKQDVAVQQILEHVFHLWQAAKTDPAAIDDAVTRLAPSFRDRRIEVSVGAPLRLEAFIDQELVGHQWATLCLRRSHIEAFNTLFGPVLGDGGMMETDEIDELIREKAEYEALPMPEMKPDGLPDSHWWWALT